MLYYWPNAITPPTRLPATGCGFQLAEWDIIAEEPREVFIISLPITAQCRFIIRGQRRIVDRGMLDILNTLFQVIHSFFIRHII